MPYYVRAFCTSTTIPTVLELETVLKSEYPFIRLETEDGRDNKLKDMEYFYKEGKLPIVVECHYNDGPESLVAGECEEFMQEIEALTHSTAKSKVLTHLKNTKYIVSSQLLDDIDDDGFHLNGELLTIFINKYGGLIQADCEGFYEGHNLIIELP